ncbi:MAG TPA: hypothetical protein PKY96_02260, partial [Flavobacteriales bacterium]|nr:hypothetical protein [Flavobacteriales bacterium]
MPYCFKVSITGIARSPRFVSPYSVRGGTTGYIVRVIRPCFSNSRNVAASCRSLMSGMPIFGAGDDVVKVFNCTGWENLADPRYGNDAADMFMAGGSA